MLSESARISSAGEARYRVQAPNSTPRATKVVALDAASEVVVRRLARGTWKDATFLTAASHDEAGDGALRDLDGRARSVTDEVDAADLIILIAGPGGHAQAVSPIGQACSLRRVMTTGFVIGITSASESELSKTLAQLRPWSLMVVIASSDDYIDDMMSALRA
jgi:hypothetical protein